MTISKREQERYSALSERAENEDYTPIDQLAGLAAGQSTSSEELDALMRDHDAELQDRP